MIYTKFTPLENIEAWKWHKLTPRASTKVSAQGVFFFRTENRDETCKCKSHPDHFVSCYGRYATTTFFPSNNKPVTLTADGTDVFGFGRIILNFLPEPVDIDHDGIFIHNDGSPDQFIDRCLGNDLADIVQEQLYHAVFLGGQDDFRVMVASSFSSFRLISRTSSLYSWLGFASYSAGSRLPYQNSSKTFITSPSLKSVCDVTSGGGKIQEANMPGISHSRLVVLIIWTIAIRWTIALSDSCPKHSSGAAPCRHKIQYNEKSWNNTPFRAFFQHKKKIPDLKLYQVWYLLWGGWWDLNPRSSEPQSDALAN